jgi:hypothetical protein
MDILFPNLCRVSLLVGYPARPVPESNKEHFVIFSIAKGLHTNQPMREDEALVALHQKQHECARTMIVYPPNPAGIWRIIPTVPMARTPEVSIEFHEPGIQVEVVGKARTPNACIQFKIKDRGGYIKTWRPIKCITLDARL